MNENVEKAVEQLELHQLKKLIERAKAGKELSPADLKLLHRFSTKLDIAKAQIISTKSIRASQLKKQRPGRPTDARKLADKIARQALDEISVRQARGEKLTGADYAFLEKMRLEASVKKDSAANVIQLPRQPETWAQRLGRLKEQAVAAIEYGVANECGNARAAFAKMALELVDQTIPPDIETVHVRFDPIGEADETNEESA